MRNVPACYTANALRIIDFIFATSVVYVRNFAPDIAEFVTCSMTRIRTIVVVLDTFPNDTVGLYLSLDIPVLRK